MFTRDDISDAMMDRLVKGDDSAETQAYMKDKLAASGNDKIRNALPHLEKLQELEALMSDPTKAISHDALEVLDKEDVELFLNMREHIHEHFPESTQSIIDIMLINKVKLSPEAIDTLIERSDSARRVLPDNTAQSIHDILEESDQDLSDVQKQRLKEKISASNNP